MRRTVWSIALIVASLFIGIAANTRAAQASATVYVPELAKVRAGPGTVYDEIGRLGAGETVPAIGRSQYNDWIQIEFPLGAGGVGWVYTALVEVRGATLESLPVAAAPPTATLPPTPAGQTIGATAPIQSPTRLPTFTPAPAVEIPAFENSTSGGRGFPPALFILALFGLGVVGGVMAVIHASKF